MAALATRRTPPRLVVLACLAAAFALGCRRDPPPGPALQVVGESSRLRTGDPIPETSPWFDGSQVVLVAARGETLGLQVLHRDAAAVSLAIPAPAVQVRGFAVERFSVTRPSTEMYGGSHGAGAYPDGLSPSQAPASDPAYFEIEVARDAVPGVRQGELVVGARRIPVVLTIAALTISPALPGVWAYEDPREYTWASGDENACIAMFRAHGVLLSPDIHLEDWPARREQLAGIHDVPVWITDDPVMVGEQVKGWIAALSGSGQVPFAIPIDEPANAEQRKKVRALAEVVRAAGGGSNSFRFAVTDTPHPEYGEPPDSPIDLYLSPRAPHLTGDRVSRWTYNGAPPQAGASVLDAESPGMRTRGWIAWRWQIPIWYVWDALYWHDRHNRKGAPLPGKPLDPVRDPVSFDDGEDHGNFDGVLALPSCRPTLRLAQLWRGYQDRALLELAARCDRAKTEQLAAELVPRALGDAGKLPASWPRDEATWERARRRLIELAGCAP